MTRPGAVRHACPSITAAQEDPVPVETKTCPPCGTAVFHAGGAWWEADNGELHTATRCRAYRAANGEGAS